MITGPVQEASSTWFVPRHGRPGTEPGRYRDRCRRSRAMPGTGDRPGPTATGGWTCVKRWGASPGWSRRQRDGRA